MQPPVNHRHLDPAAIPAAVDRALMLIKDQLAALDRLGLDPRGLRVMEIGPGSDFGPALLLASMGAQVALVDRFMADWQEQYHAPLYAELARRWTGETSELQAAIDGHDRSNLRLIRSPAEAIAEVADQSIDLVYSWGVLEHIVDIELVSREIGRVLRPGGYSAHFIDWSCHQDDYARPLQHLLWPDKEFYVYAEEASWEFGNRYRPSEIEAAFEAAAMALTALDVVLRNPEAYVAEAIRQLRDSPSPYRSWPEAELGVWAGWMFAKKLGEGHEIVVARGNNTLALMRELKAASKTIGERIWAERVQAYPRKHLIAADQVGAQSDGFMWWAGVPSDWASDTADHPGLSAAVLLEDGTPLGPAHSVHDQIRRLGHGRYSHWNGSILFSTSDNTSPRENGRRYELAMP